MSSQDRVKSHHGSYGSVKIFQGPLIPLGCRIDYWNETRKRRVKDGPKFEPTFSEGIFLGYVIHPEFLWKDEFFVASLKQLIN